jgi:hypothetical protein
LAALCACALLSVAGCGKRGNPMPPLVRVPAAPADLSVTRIADDVYVRLTVPSANIDGVRPGDIARVDVYAVTLDGAQALADVTPEDLRASSTLVASLPVRRALGPESSAPTEAAAMSEPGVEQGEVTVVREALTADARVPVPLPSRVTRAPAPVEAAGIPRALVAPNTTGPSRYYYAVAVSPRGRYGPHSAALHAPLAPTAGPPSQPHIAVEETSMTLRWTPPVDARGQQAAAEGDLLPSRSVTPVPPTTAYDVYETPRNATADGPVAVPTPLNETPIAGTEYTQQNITLGSERCFYVRAVDTIDGVAVRGPASPVGCASFADVFPPAPPRDLLAASVPGAITLIWEASESADVAGYIVLRGDAGSATLTPVTPAPVTELRYRDESVQTGTRYVYAVVAVDRAGNRSSESNRVEETSR